MADFKGLFGGIGRRVGGLLAEPERGISAWDKVGAIGDIWAGVDPNKRLADRDAATSRQLELDKARAIEADIQRLYGNDPAGALAARQNAGFQSGLETERRAPVTYQGGVDGGHAYSFNPRTGDLSWGAQRDPSYSETTAQDGLAADVDERMFQRQIAEKTLSQRIKEAEDQRRYQEGTLGLNREEFNFRRSQPTGGAVGGGAFNPGSIRWDGQ